MTNPPTNRFGVLRQRPAPTRRLHVPPPQTEDDAWLLLIEALARNALERMEKGEFDDAE